MKKEIWKEIGEENKYDEGMATKQYPIGREEIENFTIKNEWANKCDTRNKENEE